MAYDSPPLGCRALAVFSLLVGIGGLLSGAQGVLTGFLIGPFHLAAAYGLWTGAFWGWYVGMAAYGLGGLGGLWELRTNPGAGVVSVAFAALVVAYIYRQDHHYGV